MLEALAAYSDTLVVAPRHGNSRSHIKEIFRSSKRTRIPNILICRETWFSTDSRMVARAGNVRSRQKQTFAQCRVKDDPVTIATWTTMLTHGGKVSED